MTLKGKTAIITGASDGLGKQIALKLAREGVNLALISRNEPKLRQLKKEAESSGQVTAKIYPCDVRQTPLLEKTINTIAADFQNIHILINNAGIWQKKKLLEEIEENVVDDVIQTNLTALIHCTRLALPYLKKQKEAAIINISSKSGVTAIERQTVYGASKWGVRGFTEVLKADLKGSNVQVAGVYQAGTNTGMFAKAGETMPLEKFIEPEDLANVIVFMLSRPPKTWLHEVRVEY